MIDVGCGTGETSIWLARHNYRIRILIFHKNWCRLRGNRVVESGLNHCVFVDQMPVEKMLFGDSVADIVVGKSVLHHTDLSSTSRGIHRVLKPGGRAFIEPLDHNPMLNLFRHLTPHRRTPTEKPLSYGQIGKFWAAVQRNGQKRVLCACLGCVLCEVESTNLRRHVRSTDKER